MKKLRNLLMKNFHYLCIVSVIALGLMTIVGTGGGDGGNGGGDIIDSCDGPVPCLTTNWNGEYYEFKETDGSLIIATSEGDIFAGAGFTDEGYIIALAGTTTDCYNGIITEGAYDYDLDGIVDHWFTSVSGNVNICDRTLRISNYVIEGVTQDNIVATYQGIYASLKNGEIQTDINPEILQQILDKMNNE